MNKYQNACNNEIAEYEWKRQLYDEGRKTWDIYQNIHKEEAAKFDKYVMFVSAGSFGISFAFIDKIIPLQSANDKRLLALAWIFFASSLVLSIFSFLVSSKISHYFGEKISEKLNYYNNVSELSISNDGFRVKGQGFLLKVCPIINWGTFLLCSGGFICLMTFVSVNL